MKKGVQEEHHEGSGNPSSDSVTPSCSDFDVVLIHNFPKPHLLKYVLLRFSPLRKA